MKLCDLFTRVVITAKPVESLEAVALRMQEHNVGAVVIVEGGRPVGMVTDRDLALALGAEGVRPQEQVQKVMNHRVLAIPEDAGIFTATKYMRDCQVRRLPIVDREDRLVGIVTLDDLVRCLGGELRNLVEGIRHEMEVK
jgi:CBS domain-containing protein